MKNIFVSLLVCAVLLCAAVQAQTRNRGRGGDAIARVEGYEASDGYTVWARRVFRRRPASPRECAVACTALGSRCRGFTYHKRHRACFGRKRIPAGLGSDDAESDGRTRGGRFAIKYDPSYVTYAKRNVHDDFEVPDRSRGRHHETVTSPSVLVTSRPADVRQPRPSRRPVFGPNRSFAKSTRETTTTPAATATTRRSWFWRPRTTTTQRPETTTTDKTPVTERTTRKTRPRTTTSVSTRRTRPFTTTTRRRTRPFPMTTRRRTKPYTTTTRRRTRPYTTTEATTTTTTKKSGFVWFWNRNKDTKTTTTTTAQPETTTRRRRTRPTTTTTLRTTTERKSRVRTRPTTTTAATTTTRRRTRPRKTTRAPTTVRRTRPRTRFTTTTRPTTTTTTTTTQRRTRPRTTTTTERTTTTRRTIAAAPSAAGECRRTAIGMESGDLLDKSFSASSTYLFNYASNARLNSGSAWMPSSNSKDQYLEITLDEPRKITGVALQGTSSFFSGEMYVKSYEMDYKDSTRQSEFTTYKDRRGNSEIEGCSDGSTPTRHDFRSHFTADVVRIRPLDWHKSIAVRAELYVDGC